ncbi:MAG: response regulator transcription factor [Chloroflexi bacterium]|nr:response regulator transcription factor [Chloroflexota bacterium]
MVSTQAPLRVLMVDDHPVVRDGLRAMLSHDGGIQLVGEASDGTEALEMATRLEPDVVLMDIRMPGMSGIEVTRHLKVARPTTAIIVLTMYDSEMYVIEALRAGAAGYLVKDSSRELLCHTIRAVVDGGTMVRSGLLRQAIQGLSRMPRQSEGQPDQPLIVERFTARELDVLRLVSQGRANREIAGELHLAEVTVKKYVQSIIAKLGVSDRTLAAIAGVRLGLVE